MKEVLERYEYLMVYRLMNGRGLVSADVRELLDGYYKLRKAVEEGSGRFVNRPYEGAQTDGPSGTTAPAEGSGTASAAAAAPSPQTKDKKPEPEKKAEAEPPKMTGQGAKIKNEALAMYDALRRVGVTRQEILDAGMGSFGEAELDLMVNRRKVDFTFWQAFHDTLYNLTASRICL